MDLQGKLIFQSSPVLFLGFDCVKVRQVDDIWPYCGHGSPTDTTMEKKANTIIIIIHNNNDTIKCTCTFNTNGNTQGFLFTTLSGMSGEFKPKKSILQVQYLDHLALFNQNLMSDIHTPSPVQIRLMLHTAK